MNHLPAVESGPKDQVINGALRDPWLEAPLAPGGQTLRERWKVLFASGA